MFNGGLPDIKYRKPWIHCNKILVFIMMAKIYMSQSIRILPKIGISCRDLQEKNSWKNQKNLCCMNHASEKLQNDEMCEIRIKKWERTKRTRKKISVTLELNKKQCQLPDFRQTKIEFHFLSRFSVSFFILFSNISVSERVRRLLCPRVIPAWILFYLADLDYSKNICR